MSETVDDPIMAGPRYGNQEWDPTPLLNEPIPRAVAEALQRWVQRGTPCGGFLMAVLRNDLKEAVGRADRENNKALLGIVQAASWKIPGSAWGSEKKVNDWIDGHALLKRYEGATT